MASDAPRMDQARPSKEAKLETLTFPADDAIKLENHLPPIDYSFDHIPPNRGYHKPFVTLTFATSLDSALSLAPGVRTVLSGPESKAMTHYLRSRHAAICVGVGTAIADDPGLNCRLGETPLPGPGPMRQPRPIVIDPSARWALTEDAKVLQLVRSGQGLAPFILISSNSMDDPELAARRRLLERHGGKYIPIECAETGRFAWDAVLEAVSELGLPSIMIEGGGQIINSLLSSPDKNELIDSVIVTIAPTWLGEGGVVVSPPRTTGADGEPFTPIRLADTLWHPLGEDVVLCGKISR